MRSFVLLLLPLLFLASCHSWEDPGNEFAEDIDKLVVDPGFDWQTSSNIRFIISNAQQGTLKITSTDRTIIYHKGNYTGDPVEYEVSLNLPDYIKEVRINGFLIPIEGNIVTYNFGLKNLTQPNDYSLLFDGNNDYINIDDEELIEEYPFTLAAWIKTDGFSNSNEDMVILNLADPSKSNRYYGIYIDADEDGVAGMKARKGSTKTNVGTTDVTDDEWHFIVGIFQSGNNRKLYVDGTLESTGNSYQSFNDDAERTVIGRWGDSSPGDYFNGNIDEVSLWDIALNSTQVNTYMNNPPSGSENGLVGYWNFDEGSGSAVEDQTSNENDGTIHGAQWTLDGGGSSNDNDGDGVVNDEDDYPNDFTRAYDNLYPASGYGTLAFEDLWPGTGDYDFNDLVVDFQYTTVTNAANFVVDIQGAFIIKAIGASLDNGFGFQFPNDNVSPANLTVTGYVHDIGYVNTNANGTEAGQSRNTVIVFENAQTIMPKNPGESNVNTDPAESYQTPDTVTITMSFTANTYTENNINISNFNPFIIVDMVRGKEIHLANNAPTSLADTSFFGTFHDNSNSSIGRYYKTDDNLPWAIKIYESFAYPSEKNEITAAHLRFAEWAQTSGENYSDWYQDNAGYRNNAYIYSAGN